MYKLATMFEYDDSIPLSLYIHIPWCIRKCPYCDFNSHALKNSLPEQEYLTALIKDLDQDLARLTGKREIISIFFGGGTPSLFSPAAIAEILEAVNQRLTFSPSIEITLEANPGTVEQKRFQGFKQAGVNRLSLGIQSFQPEKLKALGRIHDDQEAIVAIKSAKSAGFENFNLDLMFGLPQQTLEDALFDIQTAVALEPTHLSWYQLTLEPNTLFFHQRPKLPADDYIWEMQAQGQAYLAAHGFRQYEISAYSQAQLQCHHNLNYWEFGDYLGIGAGAHGKITGQNKEITRLWKVKHPKDYLDPEVLFTAGQKPLEPKELPLEFMMNVLRLNQTIPTTLFEQRTGLKIDSLNNSLNHAQERGLLTWDDQSFSTTPLGKRYLNELLEIFL